MTPNAGTAFARTYVDPGQFIDHRPAFRIDGLKRQGPVGGHLDIERPVGTKGRHAQLDRFRADVDINGGLHLD